MASERTVVTKALNLRKRFAVLSGGDVWPIARLLDADEEDTDDLSEIEMVLIGSDTLGYTAVYLADFEERSWAN